MSLENNSFKAKFTLKPLTPHLSYEALKSAFIQSISHFREQGYTPKYRFNDADNSIEVGDFYSIFMGCLPKESLLGKYLPDLYRFSLSDFRATSMYVEAFLKNKGENSVLIKNNVLIAYDGGHPNLEKAIRESEAKSLKRIASPAFLEKITRDNLIKSFSHQNTDKPFRLIIGERHGDSASRQLVLDAIRNGLTKSLFLEGFYYDGHQDLLDNWLKATPNTPLPIQIQKRILECDSTIKFQNNVPPLEQILEAAKAFGVRVIGIDSEALCLSSLSSLESQVKRTKGLNYYASQVIRNEVKSEDGFIALVGIAHSTDVRFSNHEKSIGLDRLCGATSVIALPFSSNHIFTDPRVILNDITAYPHVVVTHDASPTLIANNAQVQLRLDLHLKNKIKSSWNTVQNVFIAADTPKTSSTHTPIPEDFSLKKHNTSGKSVAISGGLTLLGLGSSINSLKKGDYLWGGISLAEVAAGGVGLGANAALAAKIGAKEADQLIHGGKAALQTVKGPLKGATILCRAIPYVGAAFSLAGAVHTSIELGQAIEAGNTKEIIKKSAGLVLDMTMTVTDLIPVIGTPITLGLIAARLQVEAIIDQAWDPDAYKKTFEILKSDEATWFDKTMATITGVVQYVFNWTPHEQISQGINKTEELKALVRKQKSELQSHILTSENAKNFFKTSEATEEKSRILDFTAGSLSHYAGRLEFKIHSSTRAEISVGGKTETISLGDTSTETLVIKMSQGAEYRYVNGMEEVNVYMIRVAEERVAKRASASHSSSHYYAPKDGTKIIFVAPTHEVFLPQGTALPVAGVENKNIHYTLEGGTKQSIYKLSTGEQNTTILLDSGFNLVSISLEEDIERTIEIKNYKKPLTSATLLDCTIELEGITVKHALLKKAQFGVRRVLGSETDLDFSLKIGKTTLELPCTKNVKILELKTDNGSIILNTLSFSDEISSEKYTYKNVKDYDFYYEFPHEKDGYSLITDPDSQENIYIPFTKTPDISLSNKKNTVKISLLKDEEQTINISGYREPLGSSYAKNFCKLWLEGLTLESILLDQAQIGRRHWAHMDDGSYLDDLSLTLGKTTINILRTRNVERLEIMADDGWITVDVAALNNDVTYEYAYQPLKDRIESYLLYTPPLDNNNATNNAPSAPSSSTDTPSSSKEEPNVSEKTVILDENKDTKVPTSLSHHNLLNTQTKNRAPLKKETNPDEKEKDSSSAPSTNTDPIKEPAIIPHPSEETISSDKKEKKEVTLDIEEEEDIIEREPKVLSYTQEEISSWIEKGEMWQRIEDFEKSLEQTKDYDSF